MHHLVTTVPAVVGLVGVAALAVHVAVMGARRPPLEASPDRRELAAPGRAVAVRRRGLGPVWVLSPGVAGAAPADTRDLPVWEHPRTGDRLACPRCREGWLWLWWLPEVPGADGDTVPVVLAECRCGVVWRVARVWASLASWAASLPPGRQPRRHRGSERARHLGWSVRFALEAGDEGRAAHAVWSAWTLDYDEARRAYVCPTCRRPAPDAVEGEPRRCAGCGRDLGASYPARRGLAGWVARVRGR